MFQVTTAGRFAVAIFTVFAVALFVTAPARGVIVGVSVGQNGTGFTEPGSVVNVPSLINDLRSNNSSDITSSNAAVSYTGISYGSTPTWFNHITVDMYAGYVISGFNVQVATSPNPNPAVNGDWTTVQSYSGLTGSSGPGFNISLPETMGYGVRVVSTDKSNTGGYMRTSEVWVFDNYQNVAPLATVTGGLTSQASLNDEIGDDQAYAALPLTATLTWATPQLLGALMLTGGSGNNTETLIDYTITANGNPTPLETVTGNSAKTNYFLLSTPVLASSLTLHVTAADTGEGGIARVGEIWAFDVVPEPASMSLVMVGGVMLLKRRR